MKQAARPLVRRRQFPEVGRNIGADNVSHRRSAAPDPAGPMKQHEISEVWARLIFCQSRF
jgi:hypothetical protein